MSYYNETLSLEQATSFLRELLSQFPFSDWREETRMVPIAHAGKLTFVEPDSPGEKVRQSRSQAVQVAAMISQFAGGLLGRDSLRLGFIFNANAPRSGKTLLVKLITIPVNGKVALQSWSSKDEEIKKILDSEVLRASTYIVFDNVKGHIQSQVLEAFMTSTNWTGRVLGHSQMFEAANAATVFITGNECTVSPDIANRCLLVDLFVGEADVQAREVENEIDDAWLMNWTNRHRILSALWTMVRLWNEAGRPKAALRQRRGFGRWCEVIGSIVAYAGFGDCLAEPVGGENVGDTEGSDMRSLVTEMAMRFEASTQGIEFKFQEIVNICHEHGLYDWMLDGKEVTEAGETNFVLKPEANSRFGKLLKRYAPMKEQRVFRLTPTFTVMFSCSGKDRHRRYLLRRG